MKYNYYKTDPTKSLVTYSQVASYWNGPYVIKGRIDDTTRNVRINRLIPDFLAVCPPALNFSDMFYSRVNIASMEDVIAGTIIAMLAFDDNNFVSTSAAGIPSGTSGQPSGTTVCPPLPALSSGIQIDGGLNYAVCKFWFGVKALFVNVIDVFFNDPQHSPQYENPVITLSGDAVVNPIGLLADYGLVRSEQGFKRCELILKNHGRILIAIASSYNENTCTKPGVHVYGFKNPRYEARDEDIFHISMKRAEGV
jgi:hypothetical protein